MIFRYPKTLLTLAAVLVVQILFPAFSYAQKPAFVYGDALPDAPELSGAG